MVYCVVLCGSVWCTVLWECVSRTKTSTAVQCLCQSWQDSWNVFPNQTCERWFVVVTSGDVVVIQRAA